MAKDVDKHVVLDMVAEVRDLAVSVSLLPPMRRNTSGAQPVSPAPCFGAG
jgi:hypothetical protein